MKSLSRFDYISTAAICSNATKQLSLSAILTSLSGLEDCGGEALSANRKTTLSFPLPHLIDYISLESTACIPCSL
jgi:hypothetical protein